MREEPTKNPSSTPTTMDTPNPTMVTQKVFHAASASGPENSAMACAMV